MQLDLDQFSSAYNDNFEFSLDNELMLNWYSQRLINYLKGKSVLELGLGHGYTAINFSKYIKDYLILDGSPEIINLFNNKYPNHNIEIIETYFEKFNSDRKFHNIVMGFILEHVDNPAQILQKYKDYLIPGGSIFITVPNCETLNKRYGYEAGLLDDLYKLTSGDLALGHKHVFSVDKLKSLVTSQGYKIHKTEGIFLKPITTQQIKQLNLSKEILLSMFKVGINYPELCVAILMEIKL